ncbi:MAG: HAD family hydrolase [Pirellulales bacterium]
MRETAEFINLYSRQRGVNRFPGVVELLRMLRLRPEVQARGVRIDVPAALAAWCAAETRLGNPALQAKVDAGSDHGLRRALDWSLDVNRAIDDMVHDLPPFPLVRECLASLAGRADAVVCSATPNAALEKEWAEHDLTRYVTKICGQEIGSKKEILQNAKKYPPRHTLMIGDAPGDYQAALANDCLFFPINPGREDASWKRLHDEGLSKFFDESFDSAYQATLLEEFMSLLPERPAWSEVEPS